MSFLCCSLNWILNYILEICFPPSFLVLFCSIVFAILLIQCFKELGSSCAQNGCSKPRLDFNYFNRLGPKCWKKMFPDANGEFQSPINVMTQDAECHFLTEPLMWNHYEELPCEMYLTNTGHTVHEHHSLLIFLVELKAKFFCNSPTLSGADLLECYSFINLCFRWSYLDDEGSEHTINYRKYPMELQVMHLSRDTMTSLTETNDSGILMLSYFYSITKNDNPFLDPIILNLYKIKTPGSCVKIPPFPLLWLCHQFKANFYSYGGSLTQPPCSEGVTWFLYPEPLAISIKQLCEFRSLISKNDESRILKNSRPIQILNNRIVWFNQFYRTNSVAN